MNRDGLVLVTGASGFIGGALAKLLIAKGYSVRALARGSSPHDNIPAQCEIFPGDITDQESLPAAMAGVRYVFHVAAHYRLWAPDPRPFFQVNVQGTEMVMREALRAGVERIVHTSSVATLGLPDLLAPALYRNAVTVGGGLSARPKSARYSSAIFIASDSKSRNLASMACFAFVRRSSPCCFHRW